MSDKKEKSQCPFCYGTGVLGHKGIMRVYLLPNKMALIILATSILLAISFWDWRWLFGFVIAWIYTLANADFRLTLFPYIFICWMLGEIPACPECGKAGGLFHVKQKK